ncbi:efflux RND transporter periplasmic adaptor subunit [Neorhodopirellula pilleata]|uniref:Cobalt-zinc-cadmium resistance protein CzcB n=1 Tax=Neorhodopirellula pilleata TaxID=2714738 RepID=A0A5C6A2J1_9BACT|nr:efflux RND transporter periplasmic adaptor subunit [Neorhodopirellula pilleata]TWT93729.1 Cobalt-zinc-cadmium resistance protein CzcB [Neorhodopirellula pilleata]
MSPNATPSADLDVRTPSRRSRIVAAILIASIAAITIAVTIRRFDEDRLEVERKLNSATEIAPTVPVQFANFQRPSSPTQTPTESPETSSETIELSPDRWQDSGIELQTVLASPFSSIVRLTGKVSLNQDRVAHIFPMVEGTVDSVSVGLGDLVEAGQLLATIHSREIGESKLKLFQARLQLEMAQTKHELQTEVARNTEDLIKALRDQMPIEKIESEFRSRPMGEYRERLLAAYSNYTKSQADVSRLQGITMSGAVSGKSLLNAEANRNADLATFQSRLEETAYGLRVSTLLSSHSLKEAETQAAVAETTLHILGVRDEELQSIDPAAQGEAISHYQLRAPFDGTVLTKDVVLSEQVRPDVMLLSIADLSTVWILADLYQEHIPLLGSLDDQTIQLRSESWPDQVFEAKVFFAGETMDESTRTISMRAIADNAQRLLKPGMFVSVELPGTAEQEVLQVPIAAVQQHEGQKFVFVHQGNGRFKRRDVVVGRGNETTTTIQEGISSGESVVVQGGFILKSQMLADLMGEE